MAGILRRAIVPAARQVLTQISRPTAIRVTQVMDAHVGAGSGGRVGGWAVRSPPQDIPFAVKGLQHIGLAVPDLSAAAEHYRSAFGAQVSDAVVRVPELISFPVISQRVDFLRIHMLSHNL